MNKHDVVLVMKSRTVDPAGIPEINIGVLNPEDIVSVYTGAIAITKDKIYQVYNPDDMVELLDDKVKHSTEFMLRYAERSEGYQTKEEREEELNQLEKLDENKLQHTNRTISSR